MLRLGLYNKKSVEHLRVYLLWALDSLHQINNTPHLYGYNARKARYANTSDECNCLSLMR